MQRLVILAGMALASTVAGAQQPPAAHQTVQQAFEAAAALDQTGTPAARLAAWEALEPRIANNKRSRAIVQVRKSGPLLALDRKDEAVAAARAGLAGLPADDPSLREDRFLAQLSLAQIADSALDYASAAEEYRKAETIAATLSEKATVWIGLIRTETFTDPDRAAATAARADAALAGQKVEPKLAAVFRRLSAERLLNRGDFAGAQREAGAAVKFLGGLTTMTDSNDVAARSDYAVAAMLGGKPDAAREYMAMTGAGRLPKGDFNVAAQMRVPDCGGESGLKPADMAVVEFSVADDGQVVGARPIYAAGGGAVALEFARAASEWSWSADQVKAMPTFFRTRARVEMRCSTAFGRPSVENYLRSALNRWLADKSVDPIEVAEGGDAALLPRQRAALAAALAKDAQSAALVRAAMSLALNSVVPREEALAALQQALAVADTQQIPLLARLAIEQQVWVRENADGAYDKDYLAAATAAAGGRYAADPEARTALRIMLADATRYRSKRGSDKVYLQQVADDGGLSADSPLRAAALVRLASMAHDEGNDAAAKLAFDKSGLTANQCAIVDNPPRLLHAGGVFPQEAMQWGFEGWTYTQFDVGADGAVVNERAVLSYPPFVFSKAGESAVAGARYAKTYRPDGAFGCGGQQQRIVFRMGQ